MFGIIVLHESVVRYLLSLKNGSRVTAAYVSSVLLVQIRIGPNQVIDSTPHMHFNWMLCFTMQLQELVWWRELCTLIRTHTLGCSVAVGFFFSAAESLMSLKLDGALISPYQEPISHTWFCWPVE